MVILERTKRRAELIRLVQKPRGTLSVDERLLVEEEIARALRLAPERCLSSEELDEQLDLGDGGSYVLTGLIHQSRVILTGDGRLRLANNAAPGN